MKNRKFFIISVIVLVVLALAACSGRNENSAVKIEIREDDELIKEWTLETTVTMPSQSYVGKWGKDDDPEDSYITIWNIFDTEEWSEIDFSWYIFRLISVQAHGFIRDDAIKFQTREEGISGTMTFTPNGIMLTVEQSEFEYIKAGTVFNYTIKVEE